MTEAPPVRTAFLGVSSHAEEHLLPSLVLNRGFQLSCVVSRDEKKSARLQRLFGFETRASIWQDAIGGMEAVFVAASPSFHYDVALACLTDSIPIFVEKPSAPSLESLVHLVALARERANTPTFVGYNLRHAPPIRHLLAAADAAGERRALSIRYLTNKPTAPYWHYSSILESFLFSVGVHALEMAISIAGEPQELAVQYQPLNKKRFWLRVGFSGSRGIAVSIELGNYSPTFTADCVLLTSSGRRVSTNLARATAIDVTDIGEQKIQQYQIPIPRSHLDLDGLGYQSEIEEFRQALVGSRRSSSPIEADFTVFSLVQQIIHSTRHRAD